MATVDEDLKAYIQTDSSVKAKVGTRIHENLVPPTPVVPFIWFVRTGEETFDCLGDAQGTAPNIVRFSLECVGRNTKEAIAIAALIKARCHKVLNGTMGSRTATLFCENQSEDYEPKAGGENHFISALQIEVYV